MKDAGGPRNEQEAGEKELNCSIQKLFRPKMRSCKAKFAEAIQETDGNRFLKSQTIT
jgi:hypothetical protein